ncbi:MAG TPA: SpaA isopeptide-forming pilin-related protein [Candidatus Dormibacteraeota bacterium]|nr:SpaA isopeptide-forming pilin-related protein [Candidatus Dormibacteraeota bacterium]
MLPVLAAPVVAAVLAAAATGPGIAAAGPVQVAAGLTARLTVTKASTDGMALAGAEFAVHRDRRDGIVVARLVTGPDGSASTTLPANVTYCVVETAVPPGFELAPKYYPAACRVLASTGTTILVVDPPLTPTPTPGSTPAATGELQVIQTDLSGQPVSEPGFTFDVHVGSAGGPVAATLTTSSSGTAVVTALNPATYCLVATAAPPDYQLAPTYFPGACVAVAADPSQGRSPTTVTVSDPPVPSPSPSAVATAGPVPSTGPGAPQGPGYPAGPAASHGGFPNTALSAALLGLGALLVLGGVVMIALAIRRRRLQADLPPLEPVEPEGTWYDSKIT